MTVTKQTKTLIGVGLLGLGAYLLWKEKQDKKGFLRYSRRFPEIGTIEMLPTAPQYNIRSGVRGGAIGGRPRPRPRPDTLEDKIRSGSGERPPATDLL